MKKNNKGFTLAELLIVVAIIAVLVAVSIPMFVGQLKEARYSTNVANLRAAQAAAVSDYLMNSDTDGANYVYTVSSGKLGNASDYDAGDSKTVISTLVETDKNSRKISSDSTYTSITVHIDSNGTVTFHAT